MQNGVFAASVYRCLGRDSSIGDGQRQLARAEKARFQEPASLHQLPSSLLILLFLSQFLATSLLRAGKEKKEHKRNQRLSHILTWALWML